MNKFSDEKIVDSWKKNVRPWVRAIQQQEIESRALVTNQAIMDAVLDVAPGKVLDVGCGEGWLVRALVGKGMDCLGIDVVPEFVEHARHGAGRFRMLAYEELSYEAVGEKFDALVCNFSLLGEASVAAVFAAAPGLLSDRGALLVQTLHPAIAGGDASNVDGWRPGSWAGFSRDFRDPAPWYFRTIDSWKALFAGAGFGHLDVRAPLNPKTQAPASILFIGKR